MLCYCYVILCYVILCYLMLCYVSLTVRDRSQKLLNTIIRTILFAIFVGLLYCT